MFINNCIYICCYCLSYHLRIYMLWPCFMNLPHFFIVLHMWWNFCGLLLILSWSLMWNYCAILLEQQWKIHDPCARMCGPVMKETFFSVFCMLVKCHSFVSESLAASCGIFAIQFDCSCLQTWEVSFKVNEDFGWLSSLQFSMFE